MLRTCRPSDHLTNRHQCRLPHLLPILFFQQFTNCPPQNSFRLIVLRTAGGVGSDSVTNAYSVRCSNPQIPPTHSQSETYMIIPITPAGPTKSRVVPNRTLFPLYSATQAAALTGLALRARC